MKSRRMGCLIAFALTTVGAPFATLADDRDDYVSDASFIVGTYQPNVAERTPESRKAAADAFLATLEGELSSRASLELDHPERKQWTNVPPPADAGGVRLGELNEAQVKAACDVLATLLSDRGYAKMRDIMLADDQLLQGGRPRRGFGTEHFSIVVFGTPSATEPWAFQFDGHHVALNMAIAGDKLSMSPSFIGTQPESFQIGDKSYRPLGGEVDLAYKLMGSMTDDQLEQTIVGRRRGAIRTGPGNDGLVPDAQGVACRTFDESQRELLLKLVDQWVGLLPAEQAERRLKELAGEVDEMHFAWNGATDVGSDISFTVQGPSLMIEYAGQDLGGDPLDHLHTMYRDFSNDYGGQISEE